MHDDIRSAWIALRIAFVAAPLIAGIDKFFHVLVNWDMYLSPLALRVLGPWSHPFMLAVGVIEICVGLLMMTRWVRVAAYFASLWLLLIAINLVMSGSYYDIALRDIGLCLCAFGLGKLSTAMVRSVPATVATDERLAA